MALRLITMLLLLTACEGSIYQRERDGQIKTMTKVFDVVTIRVDDDAEYHITAASRRDGSVISYADLDSHGYGGLEIYYNGSSPQLTITYTDRNEAGSFRRDMSIPLRVELPHGYRIETFDD